MHSTQRPHCHTLGFSGAVQEQEKKAKPKTESKIRSVPGQGKKSGTDAPESVVWLP